MPLRASGSSSRYSAPGASVSASGNEQRRLVDAARRGTSCCRRPGNASCCRGDPRSRPPARSGRRPRRRPAVAMAAVPCSSRARRAPSALLETGNALGVGQVLVEPLPALRQRLRVRAERVRCVPAISCGPSGTGGPATRPRRRSDSGEIRKRSSVWLTVPSVEFSIGTTPKSAAPASTSWKTSSMAGSAQGAHRMPEVLVDRLLRERALRPEEGDFQRLLLREAGGHDLAEQPQDLLVPQRPLVPLERGPQHLRLALRPVEVDRMPVRVLGNADLLRAAGRAR